MEGHELVIVGTGLVGEAMIKCLRKSETFKNAELTILARSSRRQTLAGESFAVKKIKAEEFKGIDIAFFAGTEGEKGAAVMFAKEAIKRGVTVIDNGADFRMKKDVPLVIPEINSLALLWHQGLIANPNCSTIIMLMALWPIYRVSSIKRIIVSTYQAVSGTGGEAKEELKRQIVEAVSSEQNSVKTNVYPHPIAFNLFPEIGKFEEKGFTTEEWKTVKETGKILGNNSIAITATAVRVPVLNCHSLSIYIETERKISDSKARRILSQAAGVKIVEPYPTPQMADGKDEIFVGRIREDPTIENGLALWVVGDNIRKGAALNAVQIGERLVRNNLLERTRNLNKKSG